MAIIKKAILAGLAFGLLFGVPMGLLLSFFYGVQAAFITVGLSGFAFGTLIYLFVTSKAVEKETQTEVLGRKVFYSGHANHFLNGEAVGGKLYLLEDRLHFNSHLSNYQNHEFILHLPFVEKVAFYNVYGLVPNGLAIFDNKGNEEKFVVDNRKVWKEEISKLILERKLSS